MRVLNWGKKYVKHDYGRVPSSFVGEYECPECEAVFSVGFFDSMIRLYDRSASGVVSVWIQCPVCSTHLDLFAGQRQGRSKVKPL